MRYIDNFGLEVKCALVDIGMSQKELAVEVGLSESNLSQILNGKRKGWKHRERINSVLENTPSRRYERS